MTPIPAFRTIQTIYKSQATHIDSEAISREIAQTIRSELKQNHKIYLDPMESSFLYKLGYAILFLLTLGQISKALAYSETINEFQAYSNEIRHIHNAVKFAIDKNWSNIQTKLSNGLIFQIEETRELIECERGELFEFKRISIRAVKMEGNRVTKVADQEVEIACMGMRDLLQFIDKEIVSKLRERAFD